MGRRVESGMKNVKEEFNILHMKLNCQEKEE